MANNSSVNLDINNNSDGFDMSGGTTKRRFGLSGGDVSVSGSSGASGNTHTYPDYTSTLVGVTGSPSTGDTLIYSDSQWKAAAPTDSTGTDEKSKVSSNDTTAGYLNGKLVAGDNVTLTENNNGGNETLTIASTASGGSGTDEKSKVSSNDTTAGYLNGKLVAGSNITLTENSDGGDETLTIASTDSTGTDEKSKVSSNDTTAGYLNGKLVAGDNITLTEGSDGSDETLTIASAPGGWVEAGETWTYASASTFTISGDVTSRYRKGMKLRWKQGGGYKYGHIASSTYSSPNTTVTIIVNDDYTIANSSITDNYLSNTPTPLGFPAEFSYTPGTDVTVGNGTLTGSYAIAGPIIHCGITFTLGSTSGMPTGPTFTLPTNVTNTQSKTTALVSLFDSGTAAHYGQCECGNSSSDVNLFVLTTGGTYLSRVNINSTTPFTWTTSDNLQFDISVGY